MKEFLQKRLVRPIRKLLIQGITPEKIALSLAFGIMLGVFPVMGTPSLLCLLVALIFRLNLAALQLVNILVSPLWLVLLIPFTRAGERLFGAPRLTMTIQQMFVLARYRFFPFRECALDERAASGGRLAAGGSVGHSCALSDFGPGDSAHGPYSYSHRADERKIRGFVKDGRWSLVVRKNSRRSFTKH